MRDVFFEWPSHLTKEEFFHESIDSVWLDFNLSEKCDFLDFDPSFSNDCILTVSKKLYEKLINGSAKLKIKKMGDSKKVSFLRVVIFDFTGNIIVLVGSLGKVYIGDCGHLNLDLRVGHESEIVIGDKTTSNDTRIVAINSTVLIKMDCMLSDLILIQGFDQHGIVDMKTKKIINNERKTVVLEKHSWIGRRAIVMPGVTIGTGSIVGTGSVVTKDVTSFSAAAGVPARIIKNDISWCRPWNRIDSDSEDFFDDQFIY